MKEIDILKLIPQTPPFVMVEKLLDADEIRAKSALTISDENILTDTGFFTEAGIIENIAQTAALHLGYVASKVGDKIPKGMIGGIKNLNIRFLPAIENTINTSVSIKHEVMNAKIVQGSVYLKNEIIAECEMKVFVF